MNLDFFKDLGKLFGRKNKAEDFQSESEDPDEEMKESPKKKKAETDVLSMKDGDYGTIYGIKREYVRYATYGVVALIAIAFIYNFSSKATHDSNKAAIREESVADVNSAKRQMSNEALSSVNEQMKNGQIKGPNGNQQVNVQPNGTVAPVTPNQGRVQVQSQAPAMGSAYGNQYVLPSMLAANTRNQQESEEDKEEASWANRLKAAISFFNNSDGMNGGAQGAATNETDGTVAPIQPSMAYTAPSPYTIQAGTCIPAMLLSSINSDIEGIVSAQVINDIYDTSTGYNLLIPAGSRLVGRYDAKENGGRVAVTFSELVLPNGASYSITDSLIAVDNYGYVGLTGRVNHHNNSKITSAAIGAGIAAGASAAFGNSGGNNNNYTSGQLAQQGAMASIMTNVSNLFNKAVDQKDTVTVAAGTQFNIFVSKGLIFNGY